VKISELSPEKQQMFEDLKKEENVSLMEMSTVAEQGVIEVRNEACEMLLAYRVEAKMKGKKVTGVLNRLHVAMPEPRDTKVRLPCIPEVVAQKKYRMELEQKRKLERDLEMELGDDYILDLNKNYDLPDEEKYDPIPEIWEGHNVADFIDPEIMKRLKELEKEEEEREKSGYYDIEISSGDEEMQEIRGLAKQIRKKKALQKNESFMRKSSTKPKLPRTARKRERSVSRLRDEMGSIGVDISSDEEGHFTDAAALQVRSRPLKRKREDSEGRVRSSSKMPRDESGVRDVREQKKIKHMNKKSQLPFNRNARKGEGDRHIANVKPKHLFTGKRSIGKNTRR
jgi:nucleolar GTP-binding protein